MVIHYNPSADVAASYDTDTDTLLIEATDARYGITVTIKKRLNESAAGHWRQVPIGKGAEIAKLIGEDALEAAITTFGRRLVAARE